MTLLLDWEVHETVSTPTLYTVISIALTDYHRYNSVIFSTSSAVNYQALVVTEDFAQGAAFNDTISYSSSTPYYNLGDPYYQHLKGLQQAAQNQSLKEMDPYACIYAFGQNYVSGYANVLLVTDVVTSNKQNNSILRSFSHNSESSFTDLGWICDSPYSKPCDYMAQAGNWQFEYTPNSTEYDLEDRRNVKAQVNKCLAQITEPHCTVQLLAPLL